MAAAGIAFSCIFALEKHLARENLAPAAVDAFKYRKDFLIARGANNAARREDRKVVYAEILAIFERTGVPEGW
jgi:hypothetical protein